MRLQALDNVGRAWTVVQGKGSDLKVDRFACESVFMGLVFCFPGVFHQSILKLVEDAFILQSVPSCNPKRFCITVLWNLVRSRMSGSSLVSADWIATSYEPEVVFDDHFVAEDVFPQRSSPVPQL